MVGEQFLGRNPSHFHFNPVVKAFIFSEIFVWSSWNLIIPIFSVFVTTTVEGGSIQLAGTALSAYLITRVVVELVTGKYISTRGLGREIYASVLGIALISVSLVGLAFSSHIWAVFAFISLAGAGVGIAAPAKTTMFSTHLDHKKEALKWSELDAFVLVGVALATALGGFIVGQYGFRLLYLIAALVNIIGAIPYLLYRSSLLKGK